MKYFNKGVWNSKNFFVNKVQTPLETHITHLMFSCKHLTSTTFVGLHLTVKTLVLSRHGEIILKSTPQSKEKCESPVLSRSDFSMV